MRGRRRARRRSYLGLRLALALTFLGFLASAPGDRSPSAFTPLAADGLPVVLRTWPQSGPLAGGVPVRIAGQGFDGTTEVLFGEVPATDFAVIDGGTVLTAVAPPAPAGESLVSVTVTDDGGTVTSAPTFLYTDATLVVTPDAGLGPGDPVTVTADGYLPGAFTVVSETSPLEALLENGPTPPIGPSPYADPIAFPVTDGDGDAVAAATLMSPFGSARDRGYDPDVACPPTQAAADFGLGRCAVTFGQDGVGAVEHLIGDALDPAPAAPSLLLGATAVLVGATVDIGGINWNAAPWFGSATVPERPGETTLTVELCDAGLSVCAPAVGEATVDLTRYVDGDPAAAGVQGVFSGAALDGSITVDDASGCAPDCAVRVTQQRFDPATGAPATDSFIEATAELTVTDTASTTTTDPSAVFFSYSPVSGEPGTRVAFFGDGIDGVTGVSFVDPANADPEGSGASFAGLDLRVDGPGLVSVTVPEGPTGLVDLVVEGTAEGGSTVPGGFFVITPELIFDVEPSTGLRPGDVVTVTVRNYVPDAGAVIALVSPLINYVQPMPGSPPAPEGPPPQAVVLDFPGTDAEGNFVAVVVMPDPFAVFDLQATCPVSQDQANAGLGQCILSVTIFGQGILEHPLSFADDALPQAPSVALDRSEARPGDDVALSGVSWRGQPLLDSTTANGGLSLELCGIGGSATVCRFVGDGEVLRTRYLFDYGDGAAGELTGGALSGLLTVPDDLGGPCQCTVRVRQDVAGTSSFLEASAPLSITAPGEPAVTTTTAPALTTTTTRPSTTTTTTRPPSTTTTTRPPSTTTTTRPSIPPGADPRTDPPAVSVLLPPPPPPGIGGTNLPPPNIPPPSGGAPVLSPTPQPLPSPGAAPGASPAPGNPVTNPGSAHVKEEKAEAAEASRHLMVRRERGDDTARAAQAAAALAAAGAGCFLLLGGGAAQRRRSTTSDGRPRPRSAHQ